MLTTRQLFELGDIRSDRMASECGGGVAFSLGPSLSRDVIAAPAGGLAKIFRRRPNWSTSRTRSHCERTGLASVWCSKSRRQRASRVCLVKWMIPMRLHE